jgi:hypothetical protein
MSNLEYEVKRGDGSVKTGPHPGFRSLRQLDVGRAGVGYSKANRSRFHWRGRLRVRENEQALPAIRTQRANDQKLADPRTRAGEGSI